MIQSRIASLSFRALAAAALAASTSTALAQTFDQCGTIEAGVTCPKLFRADDQTLWLLDIPLTNHQVGDRVRVMGDDDPSCITICGQGNGCINNTVISGCSPIFTTFCTPGRPNSTGVPGVLALSGSLTISDDDLTITASSLPPNAFAFCIASQTFGPPTMTPSGGLVCLNGAIGRFQNQVGQVDANGTYRISTLPGSGAQTISFAAFPSPGGPIPVLPGDTWHFQCWHRDSLASDPTNFTEGASATFQ